MKKLILTLGLLSYMLLSMAQSGNDSIAKEKFQKYHKKVLAAISSASALRSAQTTNVQLDSVVNVNSKETDKEVYTYNSNGQVSTAISSYRTSGVWVNSEKTLYTYDSNNKLSESLVQSWDETNLVWVDYYKEITTYNAEGKLSLSMGYSWENSAWTSGYKGLCVYNANSQLLADTTYAYSYSSSTWIYSGREDYTYDNSSANLTEKIVYTWASGSGWTPTWKRDYAYTSNQLTTCSIYSYSSSVWTTAYKKTYTYDTNGNLIESVSQSWDGSAWGLRDKDSYTYNTSYLLSSLYIPDTYKTIYGKGADLDLSYNNMLTELVYYSETSTDVWSQYTTETYYYNLSGAAVFNAKSSNLKVTTTNGKTIISGLPQGETLAVYNLQGVAIYNQQANTETVSVTLPAHGVYVVKVDSESVKVVY